MYKLGDYFVSLAVTSDKGCLGDTIKKVGVYPLPTAYFKTSNYCFSDSPSAFTDSSYIVSGTVSDWKWNFGDGASATGNQASHSFTKDSTYTVQLIVTSNNECKDTTENQTVIYPMPQADFESNITAGCIPLCINVQDKSSIKSSTINQWVWLVENKVAGTNATLDTCFNTFGEYTIDLIITSTNGCIDTMTKSNYIAVWEKPNADFLIDPNPSTILSTDIDFTDLTPQTINKWEWYFYSELPDSNLLGTSSNMSPSYHFPIDTGSFPIRLVVTTNEGCKDTLLKILTINPDISLYVPNAFTPNDDGKNDFFYPQGLSILYSKSYRFFVYNRWGEVVFDSAENGEKWNGKKDNIPSPEAVYTWELVIEDEATEKQKHQGKVTLLR